MKFAFLSILVTCFMAGSHDGHKASAQAVDFPAVQLIDVADHGIFPNTGESITAKINELIVGIEGDMPVTIVFRQGRYDFYPDPNFSKSYFETNTYDVNPKQLGMVVENKSNLTIDGAGADFVFHGHMQPVTLDHAEGITIKNVNIDWEIPLDGRVQSGRRQFESSCIRNGCRAVSL